MVCFFYSSKLWNCDFLFQNKMNLPISLNSQLFQWLFNDSSSSNVRICLFSLPFLIVNLISLGFWSVDWPKQTFDDVTSRLWGIFKGHFYRLTFLVLSCCSCSLTVDSSHKGHYYCMVLVSVERENCNCLSKFISCLLLRAAIFLINQLFSL